MIATINRMSDIMGGRSQNVPMLLVAVTKADGTQREYKLAKFKKEICAKFMKFGPGDTVDMTFKENSKGFMDIVEVVKSTATASVNTGASGQNTMGGMNNSGKNKGVSLSYVMRYVLPQTHTEASLRKMGAEEYIAIATSLADDIVDYLEGKETKLVEQTTSAVDDGSADIPTPDIG